MTFSIILTKLRRNEQGASAIEFALLGPILLILVFGILQVGFGYQSYNAMRSLSADVARYAMVEYQTGNEVSNADLKTWAEDEASGAPYLMDSSRLTVAVSDSATQRVSGAKEMTLTVTYRPQGVLDFAGISMPTLDYTRPIFVLVEST